MNLSRKTEKAFAVDYLPKVLTIAGLSIYEGHDRVDQVEFPALIVYAENAVAHAEMPSETGIKLVQIRMKFIVDSSACDRAPLDHWKQQVEDAMIDIPGLQESLNKPVSGPDRRKVSGIHVHDVTAGGEPSARENTDWDEDMTYEVTVEPVG